MGIILLNSPVLAMVFGLQTDAWPEFCLSVSVIGVPGRWRLREGERCPIRRQASDRARAEAATVRVLDAQRLSW